MSNSFTFNNIRNEKFHVLEGRQKAPFYPLERTLFKYSGGYRLKKTEKGLLEINQPIGYVLQHNDHLPELKNEYDLSLRDELASWLITDDIVPLQFDDEPGRTYHVLVQNTIDDFDRFEELRSGTLQFVSLYTTGNTYTLSVNNLSQTYNIEGQEETPWTSRTRFNAKSNQYIIETNQGGKITLNYNFIAGDVLEIDYQKRKVTLNGNNLAVALSLDSHWLPLKPKEIQIKASHNTTLTYSERYK